MPYIRAVGIVIHDQRILLISRHNDNRDYFVFPGGHTEMNETTEQAAIREVFEETNVSTSIEKLLYHHIYEDESERFYYLCRYISGEPMLGDGPEKQKMTQENLYVPLWVSLSDLSSTLVYPLEIRDSILEDLKNNFANTPRVEQVIFKNLRQAE